MAMHSIVVEGGAVSGRHRSYDPRRRTAGRPHTAGPGLLLAGHWFWPLYLTAVAAFLALVRPWRPWLEAPHVDPVVRLRLHEADDPWSSPAGAGTVIARLGAPAQASDEWLPCDGAEVEVERHSRLFHVLAPLDGDDAQSRTFRLPDYRGLYLFVPRSMGGYLTFDHLDAGANRDGARGGGEPRLPVTFYVKRTDG